MTLNLIVPGHQVGVGDDGKRSALARVTLVDFDGRVTFDQYVRPAEKVTGAWMVDKRGQLVLRGCGEGGITAEGIQRREGELSRLWLPSFRFPDVGERRQGQAPQRGADAEGGKPPKNLEARGSGSTRWIDWPVRTRLDVLGHAISVCRGRASGWWGTGSRTRSWWAMPSITTCRYVWCLTPLHVSGVRVEGR